MKKSQQAGSAALVPQLAPSTMELDLGDRWSCYCVVEENGAVVAEDRIRTSATALGIVCGLGGNPGGSGPLRFWRTLVRIDPCTAEVTAVVK